MTASPQSLPGVGKTAIGVAALRAVESRRPDRLFDDPYAHAFVEAGRALFPELADFGQDRNQRPLTGLGALFYSHLVVRTRFYDEYLLAATAAGCEQVVLLEHPKHLAFGPGEDTGGEHGSGGPVLDIRAGAGDLVQCAEREAAGGQGSVEFGEAERQRQLAALRRAMPFEPGDDVPQFGDADGG